MFKPYYKFIDKETVPEEVAELIKKKINNWEKESDLPIIIPNIIKQL